jgi:hypothetical protein
VGFVDHNHIVIGEQWIDHRFPKKHPVSHVFDLCFGGGLVVESNDVANLIMQKEGGVTSIKADISKRYLLLRPA